MIISRILYKGVLSVMTKKVRKRSRGTLAIGGYSFCCGKCGCHGTSFPRVSSRLTTKEKIVRDLEKNGWRKTSRYGWVCKCYKRGEQKNKKIKNSC